MVRGRVDVGEVGASRSAWAQGGRCGKWSCKDDCGAAARRKIAMLVRASPPSAGRAHAVRTHMGGTKKGAPKRPFLFGRVSESMRQQAGVA